MTQPYRQFNITFDPKPGPGHDWDWSHVDYDPEHPRGLAGTAPTLEFAYKMVNEWHSQHDAECAPYFEKNMKDNLLVIWCDPAALYLDRWFYCYATDGAEVYGPFPSEAKLFDEADIPARGRFDPSPSTLGDPEGR